LVREAVQPPTSPRLPAAPALREPLLSLNHCLITAAAGLGLLLLAGCNTPVGVQGDYTTPQQTITGSVTNNTNGLTVGGSYQNGATNIGGTITVGK
jgi:hypothetical protein